MKCPKCGQNISDSAKFCTKCGANIPEELEKQARIKEEEERKLAEEKKKAEEEAKIKAASEEAKEEAKKETTNEADTPKETKQETEPKKEKEKKKKKKHTGLKIVCILLLIIIIVCGALYGLYKLDFLPDSLKDTVSPVFETIEGWFGKETEEKSDEEEKEDSKKDDKKDEDEKEEIKKIDDDEELVFDYYNKVLLKNTYKVPEINLDYDNVKKINDEIAKLVDSDLKKIEKATELGEGDNVSMDYAWYQNDNILSVVFYIQGAYIDYYYVYNVDVYTGKTVDNDEILEAAKIDEDDFASVCSKSVDDYYKNYLYYAGIENNEQIGQEYKKAKEESTQESNFSSSKTDMFLNKNGEVVIVAKVTTIAGAGTNNIVVNIENWKKNSKPLFENKNAADITTPTTQPTTSPEVADNTTSVTNETIDVSNTPVTSAENTTSNTVSNDI